MTLKKLFPVCLFVVIALFGYNSTAPTAAIKTKSTDTVHCVCAGKLQSPIKLSDAGAITVTLPKMQFVGAPTAMYIQNNGETIKITPVDTINSTNYVIFNKERYDFKNFHFHHRSEHWINGADAPMEIHLVYQNKISKAAVAVGLLINLGRAPNLVLAPVWAEFPKHGNPAKEKLHDLVDIRKIIDFSGDDPYYNYVGSLTTPHYDEGIAWVIFKKRLLLDKAQIDKFASYYKNNARKTFPVNNRFILTSR